MANNDSDVGSVWRRWDLHIHSPGTKMANGFGESTGENWKKYLTALEESDVQVFGITDYFSVENYFSAIDQYATMFPSGKKKFFPNIEFRLTETVSSDGKNVHTHVLFDNDPTVCSRNKIEQFLSDLKTHLTNNGVKIRCSELQSDSDYQSATVSISDLREALKSIFSNENSYLIGTAANNDGLRGVDTKSPRSMSISDELDKASHALFGSSKNTDYYLREDRYENETKSDAKPVFSGSDSHSYEDLARLSGDEPNYEPTWIKSDKTFRGLRQTLFEPQGRVFIGEYPPVMVRKKREATRFISELRITQKASYNDEHGSWFKDVIIPFNPELTAIIGNKGSGKSAIADIIALLGNSRQEEHFSFLTDDSKNRKFRRAGYAENFEGVLKWQSDTEFPKKLSDNVDLTKPESVKYLPQNYFENLTNEIEVKEFRNEIEEVVFSHVNEADRVGTAQFRELEEIKTSHSKSDISGLKTQLREINIELIDLENRAAPEFKRKLSEQLKLKREEYKVLETSKPKKVEQPNEATEEQKLVAEKIAKATKLLTFLSDRGKETVVRLTALKSDLQKLHYVKDAIKSLGSHVQSEKYGLKSKCEELGLDVEKIVSYKTDLSSIDSKISQTHLAIELLEKDSQQEFNTQTNYTDIYSVADLRAAYDFISNCIKNLKETLSAPQKRYQNYLQAINEISLKQKDIQGDDNDPKSGTIKFIEQQIASIENDLENRLAEKYGAREEISKSIFECKEKVRLFYEGLKESVESRLKDVSSDEFSVTIDASFVLSHSFTEDFFSYINQNVKGAFRGNEDGQRELQKLIADVDWNKVDSIISLINSVIEKIKLEPVSAQIKDIKKFYDFLFSFEFFEAKYELRLGGKNLNQLSPVEKGLLLLVFYLHLDKEKTPLIIDQPEDNLDNDSIFSVLAKCIRAAKKSRQVILVTHNPNLAVGADAEQIIYVKLEKHNNYKFTYKTGAIENPHINSAIVKVLEGSKPAFVQRRLAYQIR